MDRIYGSVPIQRLTVVLAMLRTQFNTTYDRARTPLFFYFVISRGVKSQTS